MREHIAELKIINERIIKLHQKYQLQYWIGSLVILTPLIILAGYLTHIVLIPTLFLFMMMIMSVDYNATARHYRIMRDQVDNLKYFEVVLSCIDKAAAKAATEVMINNLMEKNEIQ